MDGRGENEARKFTGMLMAARQKPMMKALEMAI
jgi:hypothetical protein